jgi:ribosomal protein S18 acetylase RimI-like enzyme
VGVGGSTDGPNSIYARRGGGLNLHDDIMAVRIRTFQPADTEAVIGLWEHCDLTRPWNDPRKDIERKRRVQPDLFLVAEAEGQIVGSAMAGYDGHRGWVYYFGVAPSARRSGVGRALMAEVERRVGELGCPKINLQVRTGNDIAIEFYRALGFAPDDVSSMGKRLVQDCTPERTSV